MNTIIVKKTDEIGLFNFQSAIQFISRMEGDWRLPTISELSSFSLDSVSFNEMYWTCEKTFDGFNLGYDFKTNIAYLAVEESHLKLRLVSDPWLSGMCKGDLIDRSVNIIRKYLPSMDEKKFRNLFQYSHLERESESTLLNFRWVLIEDCNLSTDYCLDYPLIFGEDQDIFDFYERFFLYDIDFADRDEAKDQFVGILDLKTNKYMRCNFYEYYEYDEYPEGRFPYLNNKAQHLPRWEDWQISY
jgi:hypothetical protein